MTGNELVDTCRTLVTEWRELADTYEAAAADDERKQGIERMGRCGAFRRCAADLHAALLKGDSP